MAQTRTRCAPEFKRRMVELVRTGRSPEELAREFERSPNTIRKWATQADIDKGLRAEGSEHKGAQGTARPPAQGQAARDWNARSWEKPRPGSRGSRLHSRGLWFVKASQADYEIMIMCRVLEVSRSGYYAWLKRKPSKRAVANAALLATIRGSHKESDGRYGAP